MLQYGSSSALTTCLSRRRLDPQEPGADRFDRIRPVGPGADLDLLDAVLEVAIDLPVAEFLGGVDAGDDRLVRLKEPHGIGRVEHHVRVDEQDRLEPFDQGIARPDVASDVDRRRALGPVDPDAVDPLEAPEAVVAVKLDEPGDRDVHDVPGRIETRDVDLGRDRDRLVLDGRLLAREKRFRWFHR